jgi:hypothetical protein
MAAPKKNNYYKLCTKPGRKRIFSTPAILWQSAIKYFEWADNNPWYKKEALKSGERAGEIIEIPTQRPYTLKGLCTYLGINAHYFKQFKQSIADRIDPDTEKYDPICEDFSYIISHIEQIIYDQKFTGAAVGVFNASLISAEIGLTAKHSHNIDGEIRYVVTGVQVI